MELTSKVMPAFDAIKAASKKDIHVSPMGVSIMDTLLGNIKGYYGFFTGGALRLDTNADGDVVQVAVWKKPGDLNRPDVKLDVSQDEIQNQISRIVQAMEGMVIDESFLNAESRLVEGAKDDVAAFVAKNPGALEGRVADAYSQYMVWANKTGHKEMSAVYFSNNLRAIKANGTSNASKPAPEQTDIEPEEQDTFVKDVMENEIYYKAAMYENLLKRMAKGDPGVTAMFVYGSPGLGKTYTCKKILRDEGVWDTKVTYKSGSIAGFTGLLQLLWDNRKGKIIVLDDNDSLLVGNIAAANILKACLNSDPDDRVVSYTKLRR